MDQFPGELGEKLGARVGDHYHVTNSNEPQLRNAEVGVQFYDHPRLSQQVRFLMTSGAVALVCRLREGPRVSRAGLAAERLGDLAIVLEPGKQQRQFHTSRAIFGDALFATRRRAHQIERIHHFIAYETYCALATIFLC